MHKNPYKGRNTLIEQSAIAPTTLTKHLLPYLEIPLDMPLHFTAAIKTQHVSNVDFLFSRYLYCDMRYMEHFNWLIILFLITSISGDDDIG